MDSFFILFIYLYSNIPLLKLVLLEEIFYLAAIVLFCQALRLNILKLLCFIFITEMLSFQTKL